MDVNYELFESVVCDSSANTIFPTSILGRAFIRPQKCEIRIKRLTRLATTRAKKNPSYNIV